MIMQNHSSEKIQRIGVYGFILNTNKEFLLVKRASHDSNANLWELPGGGLEHGEDPEIGVAREVVEETGLIVDVQFPLATKAKLSNNDIYKHTVRIAYFCNPLNPEALVKLSHEHSDFRWINLKEDHPLPISGLAKQCLDTIKKYPHLVI